MALHFKIVEQNVHIIYLYIIGTYIIIYLYTYMAIYYTQYIHINIKLNYYNNYLFITRYEVIITYIL